MDKKIENMFYIHFEHASSPWAGNVEWLSDGKIEYFRSAHEMMIIIDQKVELKEE
ncbi:hypothetical protein SG0102_22540 [Intestinibaculum porci]|uniref:Uncharacterized protein n=1 Tax=Intestinibaculum porci TaxID=2487118 RepID=A0A3G9J8E7_9FIRM|nr:hypothetical protein [Intestinibaculum porci]BBH27320.1 hypothetical protein SG0102_22540 [Intestinibaculum porci]